MTEQQWLASADPAAMLAWLLRHHGMLSGRKLRLFASAWWRSILPHTAPHEKRCCDVEEGRAPVLGDYGLLEACSTTAHPSTLPAVAALLRDIAGNPFRPVVLGREWLGCERCNGVPLDDHGCPCRYGRLCQAAPLAHAAYEDRGDDGTFDPLRLAILADALEEAGCTLEPLLRHLRGQERCPRCENGWYHNGPRGGQRSLVPCTDCTRGWIPLRGSHYRGCYALDLVLGKG